MPSYQTEKQSSLDDPKIKCIYWTVLTLIIIGLCVGLYFDPSWMDEDIAVGNIQLEVDGGASSTYAYGNVGSQPDEWTYTATVTYDAKELRIPSDEPNSLFITTWISPHQPQLRNKYCGDPTKPCQNDGDCREKHKSFFGEDQYICSDFFCLIKGWCPIQFPQSERRIDNVNNWEIFIKVVATFPTFKTSRANFDPNLRKVNALNTFTVDEILDEVGTDYNSIRDNGAIITVTVSFTCIYHFANCNPKITFQRIDNDKGFGWLYKQYKPSLILGDLSLGDSFKLPEIRQTFEVRGLRLIVSIEGAMYRFNPVGLLLTVGGFVSLLGIATSVTDFVLLNLHSKRDIYVMHKYRFIDNDRMVEKVDKQLKKHLTHLGYY